MNIETQSTMAQNLYFEGKYIEAIDVFKSILDINSRYEVAYIYLGRCYDALGERDKALEVFHTLEGFSTIIQTHQPTDLFFYIGIVYFSQKKYSHAEEYFQKDRNHNDLEQSEYRSLFYISVCRMYKEEYTLALDGFETILSERYNDIDTLNNASSCLIELGKYNEARMLTTRAINLHENPTSYFNLGVLEKLDGNMDAAQKIFNIANKINSDFSN